MTINIGGSDLWKDSVAIQARGFLPHGIAAIAVDKPGTADAPVPARPGSERMISAIIDFLQTRDDLDGSRVIVRGQSWGSYWSARAAYAEAARLKGAVFQSGPVHRYFQREWQEEAFKTKEFLFDYVPSRLHMLGVHTVEEAFAFMPSLSLVDFGLIDKPTPPMLLIAGAKDTQVPFSDFILMMEHGSPKDAWVNPQGQTMGRSLTVKDDDIFRDVVVPWVKARFGDVARARDAAALIAERTRGSGSRIMLGPRSSRALRAALSREPQSIFKFAAAITFAHSRELVRINSA